jgi:murein tripeptide amidase MpaA
MSPELAYRFATDNSDRMKAVLDNTIIIVSPSHNPDGLRMEVDWNKRTTSTKFAGAEMPWLYHKYIGHDNNRESLLCSMPESTSIARVLYTEWFPQIMYNQHQSGPAGSVLRHP